MRSVTPELAAAIVARERAVRLKLDVDWDADGHGTAQSNGKPLDDISGKASTFSRQHTLTGGLPAEVRIVEGSASAECDVDLVKGASDDEQLNAVRYFSRFNTASPLYGKERMFRDVQADVEFLTTSGWQSVPRMRGLTQALPVSAADRTAQLRVLDYRQRLRRMVTLPPIPASSPRDETTPKGTVVSPGMESTWVASYVLAQCGLYASPPPRASCRMWAPMHGSAAAVLGDNLSGIAACDVEDAATSLTHRAVRFQPGPYVLGTETVPTGYEMWLQYVTTHNQAAYPLVRPDGHAIIRFEFWAKLTSNATGSNAFFATVNNSNHGGSHDATFWLSSTNQLQMQFSSGPTLFTVNGPTVSPVDGLWHFFGYYLNTSTGQAVFRFDSTSTPVSFTAITPTAWTATDEVYDAKFRPARAGIAIAEVHVSAGGSSSDPWLNEIPFTPSAHVDRLKGDLAGLAYQQPQEAWQILSDLTGAVFGSVYCDEDGVVQVASLARLLSTQAQTVQRTVTSSTAITDLAYDDKADVVRNVVTCGYTPIEQHNNEVAWSSAEKLVVQGGSSVQVTATLSGLPVAQLNIDLAANTALAGNGTVVVDGSATSLVPGVATVVGPSTSPITARVDLGDPGTVTITIANRSPTTVWLVDSTGNAKLKVRTNYLKQGTGGTAEYRHAASIAAQGEQPLSLAGNQWRQTESAAAGAAMVAGLNLAWPQQPLTNLAIVADPRLQFYDRIHIQDLSGTQLDADYWITGSRETLGDGYTMSLSARQARQRFVAGTGDVGVDLVG